MANPTGLYGFRLYRSMDGGNAAHVIKAWIGSGDSTAVYLGDLVSINNASSHGNDAVTGSGAIEVQQSANNSIPLGVVIGFDPVSGITPGSENYNRVYRPASTAMYIYVSVDPNAEYVIRSDGTVAITDMAKYANIASSPSGSTTTGISGMALHEASITGTKAGAQMVVTGILPAADNAVNAANTDVIVRLVNPAFAQ